MILPPDTHTKFAISKENNESFSRALQVHLVKDDSIPSSKTPKSYVKLITHMNIENVFDTIIAVVFYMST